MKVLKFFKYLSKIKKCESLKSSQAKQLTEDRDILKS